MSTQDIITRIIDNRYADEYFLIMKNVLFCRITYEKRNQKKEAKEAAAYEAFQKLKADNLQETSAVNINQE
jgi:hypothetical protein